MGLVNRVVPLEELEEETVAWCREMLELSPFSLQAPEGELQRGRGRPGRDPAAGPRREPPLLRERGGAGGPRRLPREAPAGLREVPEAALSHLRLWLLAARPRTLPAAIAPVLVGTALAGSEDTFRALPFVAALVGSVFIQIGTNLSNDYSDARRGADTEDRLGPVRVTAGGLMPPRRVLVGTYVAFGVAVAAGSTSPPWPAGSCWWSAPPRSWRACSTRAARGRTATRGSASCSCSCSSALVAVAGSYFVQTEELRWEAVALGVPVGLLAAAILVVNNVRDIDTDRRAGQANAGGEARPRAGAQAVRRHGGGRRSRAARGAGCRRSRPGCCSLLAALPLAPPLVRTVATRTDGPALNGALAATGPAARRLLAAARRGRAPVVSARVERSVLRLSIPLKEPFVTSGGVVVGARAAAAAARGARRHRRLRRGGALRAVRRRAARARRGRAHRRRRAAPAAGARRRGDRAAGPARAPGGPAARRAAQGLARR